MPEKTKVNKVSENAPEKQTAELPAESDEAIEEDTWGADQRKKSYYYDDGYGYEVYNPAEQDDEDEG